MRVVLKHVMCALACCVLQQALVVAAAQQQAGVSVARSGTAETTKSGKADGTRSPALTGERRPLYRLRKTDVLEINFTFTPEFNQTVTVQPDGFIALKGVPEMYAERMTVPEVRDAVRQAYSATMHDPEVSVILKDFDKPYFIATGQVARPGKYELRADTTVTEGVAIAGGFTDRAKHSQVVLFRRVSGELIESRILDVKHMLRSRNLTEDIHLKPGDLIFVPQNTISKIRRYLPASNLSLYSTPTQF
jgi:protein involved in polysaccharide export with SLBB domain